MRCARGRKKKKIKKKRNTRSQPAARRFNTNDAAMKNWTSSPPIVPIDKREEKLVPRFHFAFPLKSNFNENTAILRPVPSKFLYFSPPPIKINFSSSIDISSYPIGEYISSLEEGGQSGGGKAWNSWNFSTSIITSSTHCAWEFSNGVHRTIFSRCVGMYPFSKGKTRATNEYALSQERERDIYIGQRRRMKSQLVTPVFLV